MDGVALQQQPERDLGRRDGLGQDDPDDRAGELPDGEEEEHGTLSHHRPSLYTLKLDARIRKVGTLCPGYYYANFNIT